MDLDRLRRGAKCIYIAVEESVADDIASMLCGSADEIERLRTFHDAWVETEVAHATGSPELAAEKRKALIAAHKAVHASEAAEGK